MKTFDEAMQEVVKKTSVIDLMSYKDEQMKNDNFRTIILEATNKAFERLLISKSHLEGLAELAATLSAIFNAGMQVGIIMERNDEKF